MNPNNFAVIWARSALRTLFRYDDIDHDDVFNKTNRYLESDPWGMADAVADYPGYLYNGLCLKLIRNVVVVYSVENTKVRVRACHHGRSGLAAQIMYGIEPEED
jgi:hypothetical protein